MRDCRGYLTTYTSVLQAMDAAAIERLADVVFTAWERGRTVFLCGNGGSAASASHIATDLVKLTAVAGGRRLRALALGESLSGLSAAANDIAFSEVFVESLRAFLSPGDVVIGLSTSGSSPNVLRAIEHATLAGAVTAGITGLNGSALQAAADHALIVPSTDVQHVEDATMVAGHLVCLLVKARIAQAHRAEPMMITVPFDALATVNDRPLRPIGSRRRRRAAPVRPLPGA